MGGHEIGCVYALAIAQLYPSIINELSLVCPPTPPISTPTVSKSHLSNTEELDGRPTLSRPSISMARRCCTVWYLLCCHHQLSSKITDSFYFDQWTQPQHTADGYRLTDLKDE